MYTPAFSRTQVGDAELLNVKHFTRSRHRMHCAPHPHLGFMIALALQVLHQGQRVGQLLEKALATCRVTYQIELHHATQRMQSQQG